MSGSHTGLTVLPRHANSLPSIRAKDSDLRRVPGCPPLAPSTNMQSSLASPPLFAGLDDLYEPVDAQQLQDDSPLLLQEEMLDLMNMNPVFGAGDDQTTFYQAPSGIEAAGNGQPLVHIMDMDEDEYADDEVTPLERPPVTMRARPSTIGRMLFPSREW